MSIRDVNPIMTPEPCHILVRINKPHIFSGDVPAAQLCHASHRRAVSAQARTASHTGRVDRPGCLIVEPGDKVRLGVLPGRATKVRLDQPEGDEQDTNLHIVLPVKKGNYVDLLLPMLPTDRRRCS